MINFYSEKILCDLLSLIFLESCMTMYYIWYMVFYDEDIKKEIRKGKLSKEIATLFVHAFESLDSTKDLNLFDIKKLVSDSSINYYRLRKGKYRAIFKIEHDDIFVLGIGKRAEVYKRWP